MVWKNVQEHWVANWLLPADRRRSLMAVGVS
jgi:hypothetical protein